MAKKKRRNRPIKSSTPSGGPFLAYVVFCESAIEDKDGLTSAMRILDNVNINLAPDAPADVPSEEKPIPHMQTCLISFKKGDASGKHQVMLTLRSPDGTKKKLAKQAIKMVDKPYGGSIIKTSVPFRVTGSGTFWLEVSLDGRRYACAPLNFTIQRLKIEKAK